MKARDLSGRVAVVTGAGRGIGRATALALAAAGARIVLASRTAPELERVSTEIDALGSQSLVVPTDVSSAEACRELVAKAADWHGRLDVLVNNAGAARFQPFWETTPDDLDFHYRVLLRSVHVCAVEAARRMMASGSGIIVNVASSSGKKPYARQSSYCAMKAAVISLSKVMALELRQFGVRVHVVCPGAVDTAMADQIHPERDRHGWIQADDVASAITYLCGLPDHVTTDEIVLRRFLADPI